MERTGHFYLAQTEGAVHGAYDLDRVGQVLTARREDALRLVVERDVDEVGDLSLAIAEEAALRAVLAHPLCAIETDTFVTREGHHQNPASYGTFARALGAVLRS